MLFVRWWWQSWLTDRPMSSLRWQNTRCQNLEKAKTNNNCVTNYWPTSNQHESKGGEIRYKILQRVAQHCFVASFGSMFRVFHLAWSTCLATKMFVDPLLQVEGKFWLSCSFFVKLTACQATNFLMCEELRVFVTCIFCCIFLSWGSLADSLLQLSFVLALLWLNSVYRGFSVSLFSLLYVRWRCLDLARWTNWAHWSSFARWPSTLLAHWPIVELASSTNIPQWHLTKVHSRRIGWIWTSLKMFNSMRLRVGTDNKIS